MWLFTGIQVIDGMSYQSLRLEVVDTVAEPGRSSGIAVLLAGGEGRGGAAGFDDRCRDGRGGGGDRGG